MSKIEIDVNTKELKALANKLRSYKKSALPVVARQTLNSLAFQFKKEDVHSQYNKKGFKKRNKSFLSVATKATPSPNTLSIKSMVAKAGIHSGRVKSKSSKNLARQQERGGTIEKTYIPTLAARVGGNPNKVVRRKYNLNRLGQISKQRLTNKSVFIKRVRKYGAGRTVRFKDYLFYVISTRGRKINMKPIYKVKDSGKIKVKGRSLVKDTGDQTIKSANKYFRKHAAKRFKK